MTSERTIGQANGWVVLALVPLLLGISAVGVFVGAQASSVGLVVGSILAVCILGVMFRGFFVVEPNEAVVLLLFGRYKGTEKESGFRWTNPLRSRKRLSMRAHNFDSQILKVNDKRGNPIEISAVIVWRINDTAQALFDVENYSQYVQVQAESAVRHLATSYPYDVAEGDDGISLRSSLDEVSKALGNEIQERVSAAGVTIIEARINHLAYAPKIAQAMLQRQQAEAVIAARTKIVEGAVGMVEMALNRLENHGVLELDEERKANMVSNLMVVLCSHDSTRPVINAGSLY